MNGFRVTEAAPRAGRLWRPARFVVSSAFLAAALATATPASSQTAALASAEAAAKAGKQHVGGQSIADFYASRGNRPLWFAPGNEQAASDLIAILGSAKYDGLDPRRYKARELQRAYRAAWGGNPLARQRAESLLSQAFVNYVRDMRRAPNLGVIYVDGQLAPQPPSPRALLSAAAAAPSLDQFVHSMGWMHPYYAQLRRAYLSRGYDGRQRALLKVNLERARLLPPATSGRYVVVNAAAQRLFMMDGGQVVDMMRVVVGKPIHPTPMMSALIRFTSLNPYWNVPPDLAAERIAPNVLKQGTGYLKQKGYQVLSDWSDKPKILSPASVDWRAVAAGRKEVRLRQLPGPANSMGDMKFMFPNAQGIYLHDTPSTELFSEASRLFSGGCIRLEAAPRLAAWMYGKPLRAKGARPEQKVMLPHPMPVYITYLTAVPSGSTQVAFYDDIYGRDARRLAQMGGSKGRGLFASR